MNLVRDGNWMIDADTGELLYLDFPPDRVVETEADVHALLLKMQILHFRMQSRQDQIEAILENLGSLVAEDLRKMNYYYRWEADLRNWAASVKGGKQSVRTPFGTLAFSRQSPELVVVADQQEEATAWAREHLPQAYKQTESLLISEVRAAMKGGAVTVPPGLFQMSKASETFTVKLAPSRPRKKKGADDAT